MIRVLILSGVRLYREGLAQMLGRRRGLTVAGMTCDRKEAAAEIQGLAPDVIIIDMATAESHAAVRELKLLAPSVPVVALGVPELEREVLACVEAGVDGYVTREASLENLVAVVESAARGELQCSPQMAGSLVRRVAALAADHEANPSPTRLTVREREIVRLIGQDLTNKQIADRLGIEVATVKNHVHNLLEKLNVHRRSEAVRLLSRSTDRARDVPGPHSKP